MDTLFHVLADEVLILHCHENRDCQEPDDRHSERSRVGSELMIANQNAHAFRPNSIVAKKRMPRSLVGVCHDQDDVCQLA